MSVSKTGLLAGFFLFIAGFGAAAEGPPLTSGAVVRVIFKAGADQVPTPDGVRPADLDRSMQAALADPARGQAGSLGLASGFLIDAAGHVLAFDPERLAASADQISVLTADGTLHDAELTGCDGQEQMAVVKILEGRSWPFLSFGDSARVRPGDALHTAYRSWNGGETRLDGVAAEPSGRLAAQASGFVWTRDVATPAGLGTPVLDDRGEVVGMTAGLLGVDDVPPGTGLAFPSKRLKPMAEDLVAHGHLDRAMFGITFHAMGLAMGGTHAGAVVDRVKPDGAAARAGLTAGSRITDVDHKPTHDMAAFRAAIDRAKPGVPVVLTLEKGDDNPDVTVVPDEWPGPAKRRSMATAQDYQDRMLALLGVVVEQPADAADAPHGLLLIAVTDPRNALNGALGVGNYITLAGRTEPLSKAQLAAAIDAARRKPGNGSVIALDEWNKRGNSKTTSFVLASGPDWR